LDERFKDEFISSNIWQIPVPEEMINKTYEKLFKFLREKSLIAMGLYRLPGACDNKYPYVCTNPSPNITITLRDRVFVLGHHIPRELICENNRDTATTRGIDSQRLLQGSANVKERKQNAWKQFMMQDDNQGRKYMS